MSGRLTHWEGEPLASWCEVWGVPLVEAWVSLGSTNERALELAAEGAGAFSVVVAEEQTEGRGRRGARWHSASGSGLWMSVVLPTSLTRPHLPLLVGLAAAEAIESAAEGAGVAVGIKWPNDLLVGPRKLGGILCESRGEAVVAGVGINLRAPPEGFPSAFAHRTTALEIEGANSLPASRLAGMIVRALERRLPSPDGLDDESLAALRVRDVLSGHAVRTEEHGRGIARGIERDGSLLLERHEGSRVRVVSGSIRPL